MSRRPFSILRAAFWLLACIVGTELAVTLVAGVGCFSLIMRGEYRIGACMGVGEEIKSVWAEMLAAILALLLAARGGNGGPPAPPPDDKGEDKA
jgi:hypothetical protein